MYSIVTEFIIWAKNNGWYIVEKSSESLMLNYEFESKYGKIPKLYLEFLNSIKQMISPNEKTWFLCEDEYNDNSELAFKWNEFELISLEAAEGDDDWKSEIKSWWNNKLPIVMSVDGGYSFYAIDFCNGESIVKGYDPEFEETELVAKNVEEFLKLIMNNIIEL